jgi:uncharacterized protein (DUF4415 family)
MLSVPLTGGDATHDQAMQGARPPPIPRTSRVSLRLDAEMLEWFRGQVREHGGGHYQYGRLEARLPQAVQSGQRIRSMQDLMSGADQRDLR